MHLRGASPDRRRGLRPLDRGRARCALLIVLPIACLIVAACDRRSRAADDVTIELTLTPNPPVAGVPARGEMALRDRNRRLLRAADLRIEAHMSHPGMTPVLANATERGDGMQDVPLQFTMAGDWTVHVTGTLADGRRLDRWLNVPGVRPAE